jgi:hypothetical protein
MPPVVAAVVDSVPCRSYLVVAIVYFTPHQLSIWFILHRLRHVLKVVVKLLDLVGYSSSED